MTNALIDDKLLDDLVREGSRRRRISAITFDRIMTPRFTKDVEELHLYDMDIRAILEANPVMP